jgi:acetylornithine aminotransferase
MQQLAAIPELKNVRGRGLMIGFDVDGELATLKKQLLNKYKVFTGEAKPNVIRLLPALNISKEEVDVLIAAIKSEVMALKSNPIAV